LQAAGKILIGFGIFSTLLGILFYFAPQIPFLRSLGQLPGDIAVKRDNFQFYFPLGTSLLLSVLLSLIFYLIHHFKK